MCTTGHSRPGELQSCRGSVLFAVTEDINVHPQNWPLLHR